MEQRPGLFSENSSNPSSSVERKALLCLFLLALGVRLIFVAFYQWAPDDAIGYDTLARNILAGHGFSLQSSPPFEPTLYRTPVYPYFLVTLYGLFGFHATVVYVAQAIIGALTCCVMYFVARLYLSPRVSIFVALACAVYPFTSFFAAAKLSETLFTLLLCATIYLVIRAYQCRDWRWISAAGAALGIAILCRPENMFFPFFLSALVLLTNRFKARWWKFSAVLIVACLIVLSPWLVRNYYVNGKLTPLVRIGPGIAFWQTTLPYFDWNTFQYAPGADQKDPIVWQLTHNHSLSEAQLAEMEPQMWRAGLANVRRDPKSYIKRRLKEYPHLWISTGDYLLKDHNRSYGEALARQRYGLIAVKVFLLFAVGLLPLALAVVGLFAARGRLIELLPLWAFPLYVTLSRLPFDIAPRNTLPAHPFMLLFAVCGAMYLWRVYVRRRLDDASAE